MNYLSKQVLRVITATILSIRIIIISTARHTLPHVIRHRRVVSYYVSCVDAGHAKLSIFSVHNMPVSSVWSTFNYFLMIQREKKWKSIYFVRSVFFWWCWKCERKRENEINTLRFITHSNDGKRLLNNMPLLAILL